MEGTFDGSRKVFFFTFTPWGEKLVVPEHGSSCCLHATEKRVRKSYDSETTCEFFLHCN